MYVGFQVEVWGGSGQFLVGLDDALVNQRKGRGGVVDGVEKIIVDGVQLLEIDEGIEHLDVGEQDLGCFGVDEVVLVVGDDSLLEGSKELGGLLVVFKKEQGADLVEVGLDVVQDVGEVEFRVKIQGDDLSVLA